MRQRNLLFGSSRLPKAQNRKAMNPKKATLPASDHKMAGSLISLHRSRLLAASGFKAAQSSPRKVTADNIRNNAGKSHCRNSNRPCSIINPTQKSIVVENATKNRKRASHHP